MSIRTWILFLSAVCLDIALGCGSKPDSSFGKPSSGTTSAAGSSSTAGSSTAAGSFSTTGGVLVVDDAGTMSTGEAGMAQSSTLMMTIRDFKMSTAGGTNLDFEGVFGDDRGIVETALGTDGKPVYAAGATGTTPTTHGQMYFDQWYRDVQDVNINVQYPITLTQGTGGTFGYDSRVSGVPLSANQPMKQFFPIDDGSPYQTAFGNQSQLHNYSFTTELHTVFTYNGGETFSFSGDDDVFVFVNGMLVIDLGGVHVREAGMVLLDTLGLTVGQQYPLDLFGAERHTTQSNVSFTTTLNLRPPPR